MKFVASIPTKNLNFKTMLLFFFSFILLFCAIFALVCNIIGKKYSETKNLKSLGLVFCIAIITVLTFYSFAHSKAYKGKEKKRISSITTKN